LVEEYKRSVVPLADMLEKSPKFIHRFVADDAVDYYKDNDPTENWDEEEDPINERPFPTDMANGLNNLLAEMVKYLLNI